MNKKKISMNLLHFLTGRNIHKRCQFLTLRKVYPKFTTQRGGINHQKGCMFKHKQEGLYFRLSVQNKELLHCCPCSSSVTPPKTGPLNSVTQGWHSPAHPSVSDPAQDKDSRIHFKQLWIWLWSWMGCSYTCGGLRELYPGVSRLITSSAFYVSNPQLQWDSLTVRSIPRNTQKGFIPKLQNTAKNYWST